jgi:hypothetical protein
VVLLELMLFCSITNGIEKNNSLVHLSLKGKTSDTLLFHLFFLQEIEHFLVGLIAQHNQSSVCEFAVELFRLSRYDDELLAF